MYQQYQQAKLSKNTLKSDVCVLRDCTVLQMVHLIFMLVWKILDPLLKVRVLSLHYFTLPICGENNHRDFFQRHAESQPKVLFSKMAYTLRSKILKEGDADRCFILDRFHSPLKFPEG